MGSIAQRAAALVKDHHDAFLLETFGVVGSGLSPERVAQLFASGLADPALVGRVGTVQVGPVYADPFAFREVVGRAIARAPHELHPEMRRWGLERWQEEIQDAGGLPGWATVGDTPAQAPTAPEAPAEAPARPEAPGIPGGMGPGEVEAYEAARDSAGEYIRGLGNEASEAIENTVAEVWDGETPVSVPMPEKRNERLEQIRALTARAVAERWTPEKLASEIGHAIGEWGRGLERIARTELQAAHNEGRTRDAVQAYGEDAAVCRVPEAGACDVCRRLFLDSDGLPIIFPVRALVANGTNVGLKAAELRATVFPVHPHCRCDTAPVPPGMYMLRDGRLRPKVQE